MNRFAFEIYSAVPSVIEFMQRKSDSKEKRKRLNGKNKKQRKDYFTAHTHTKCDEPII